MRFEGGDRSGESSPVERSGGEMVLNDLVGRPCTDGDRRQRSGLSRLALAGGDGIGDRIGAQVDAEFGFESDDDRACGGEHFLGGLLHEFDVCAGPIGDVRDRVRAGIDSEHVTHDVGDGLGLHLDSFSGNAWFPDLGVVH